MSSQTTDEGRVSAEIAWLARCVQCKRVIPYGEMRAVQIESAVYAACSDKCAAPFRKLMAVAQGRDVPDEIKLLPIVDAGSLEGRAVPAREWGLSGWEPWRSCNLLTGIGASGKSLWTQQRLTCSAAGLPFLGIPLRSGKSLYVTCEDDIDELHRRQEAINAALGISWADLRGCLKLVSLKGELNKELALFDIDGRMDVTDRWHSLRHTILTLHVQHVGLDNSAHFFIGNENIRNQVAAFVGLLDGLAQEINGIVTLLGHPAKSGAEFSGSTAWENQVRSRIYLKLDDGAGGFADPDVRIMSNSKPNYSKRGNDVRFRWHNWAFVLDEQLDHETRAALSETAEASTENLRFLECLARCTKDRRNVSHVNGSNYAPRVFARMPEANGMSVQAFERAMERLRHIEAISFDQPLWKGNDRHPKRGIQANETPLFRGAGTPAVTPAVTPCGNLREPLAQVSENPCGTDAAGTPLYTTYKERGPNGDATLQLGNEEPDPAADHLNGGSA